MSRRLRKLKKYLTVFHLVCGIPAFLFLIFVLININYLWLFIGSLSLYSLSGIVIFLAFFKTHSRFVKYYYEMVFAIPFLLIAFIIFLKLFDYFLFSKP